MLPVFSVGSEDAAKRLLTIACPRNYQGEYFAPELAEEQTLDRLYAFGDRLRSLYDGRVAYIETGKSKP